MSLWVNCNTCDGHGKVSHWFFFSKECPDCKGHGGRIKPPEKQENLDFTDLAPEKVNKATP